MQKVPRKLKIFLLIVVGLIAVKYIFFRAPSEAQMIAHFKTHKTEFEQLRSMLQQDKKIFDIGSDWLSSRDGTGDSLTDTGITQQRLNQYRILMDKLNVSPIGRFSSRENYFRFSVFGGGFTDTTWSIGYVWSDKTPENIVPSAYNTMPRNRSHSRIEGKWYIYHRR
jgi:hypothetical protein